MGGLVTTKNSSIPTRANLDIFWRQNESLGEPDSFSDPDVLAGLERVREIAADLSREHANPKET